MEKIAISGVTRYEIESNAADGERTNSDARPADSVAIPQPAEGLTYDDRPHRGQSPLALSVRSARLRDLPGLRSIRSRVLLNQPESLLLPRGPVQSAIASRAPRSRTRPRVLVAVASGTLVGYAQF